MLELLVSVSLGHGSLFFTAVTKDQPAGSPNLQIWTTERVAEFIQKKQQDWYGLCIGRSNKYIPISSKQIIGIVCDGHSWTKYIFFGAIWHDVLSTKTVILIIMSDVCC